MAYPAEKRNQAKIAYVRDRLPMEQVAQQVGVPLSTVRRWRTDAVAAGDDWDKLRSAVVLAGGDVNDMAQQVVVEMMIQFNSVLGMLKTDVKMDATKRAQALASITDSMTKAMAFMSRAMPEESRLATAMLTLNEMAAFIKANAPQYLAVFSEILGPFGEALPAIIRKAK